MDHCVYSIDKCILFTVTVEVSCEFVMVDARLSLHRIAFVPRSMKPTLGGCRPVPVNAGTVRVGDTLSLT